MFDLPRPDPTVQVELATRGISKGLAQTTGPQIVIRGGLTFGVFSVEASGKNIDSNDDGGVESFLSAGVAIKKSGFDLSARGGLKSVHGIAGQVDRRAFEMRVEAGRQFGPVRALATMIYSPNDTGGTRSALFVEGGSASKRARARGSAPGSAAASETWRPITRPIMSGSPRTSSRKCRPTFACTILTPATSATPLSGGWSDRCAPNSEIISLFAVASSFSLGYIMQY